jgi:hypothetical protein
MPGHAKDIKYRLRRWFWAYRCPAGEVTLFEGHPDMNKSSVNIDMSARLSVGAPMYRQDVEVDEEDRFEPVEGGSVFLIEASIENTFLERLLAAGCDLQRVHWFKTGEVVLPGGRRKVREMVGDTKARLLVIDPLADFIKSKNLACGVREALQPAIDYAHRTGLTVVVTRHLNRGHSRQAIYRGTGSHELPSVASSIMLTAPAPDDPDLRVLFQWRHRFKPCPPLLYGPAPARGYPDPVRQPGGVEAIRIVWRGVVDVTEEQLLGPSGKSRLQEVKDFLVTALQGGPKPRADIVNAAVRVGFGWKSIERAKQLLGIRSVRQGPAGPGAVYCWELPAPKLQ